MNKINQIKEIKKMKKEKVTLPVVKWVGGKRQILKYILNYIPKEIDTYFEPFIGGGAVLFALKPPRAVVNDINQELINLYGIIKNNIDELIEDLKKHKNEKIYFYHLRNTDRDREIYHRLSPVQKASRMIYLNKTCYNGLFRVNKAGEFNTPFGNYKNPNIVNEAVLRAVHSYLNESDIKFLCQDFESALWGVQPGDFVYLDPPYHPMSDTASFTGYNKGGFNEEEQIRLKRTCDKLNKNKIKFLLSNSATPFIKDLYKEYTIDIIKAKRAVNSNPRKRGEIDEVLVRNFE